MYKFFKKVGEAVKWVLDKAPGCDNKLLFWLVFFLLPPLGIYSTWKKTNFKQVTKILLTLVATIFTINQYYDPPPKSNYKPTKQRQSQATSSVPLKQEHIQLPINVEMTTEEILDKDSGFFTLKGSTNLPSGTKLYGMIGRQGNEYSIADFRMTVRDGKFQISDIAYTVQTVSNGTLKQRRYGFRNGTYDLSISLSHQDSEYLKGVFGKENQNLTGPLMGKSSYGTRKLKFEKIIQVQGVNQQATGEREKTRQFLAEFEGLFTELMQMKGSDDFKYYGFTKAKYKNWKNRLLHLRDQLGLTYTPGMTVRPMYMNTMALAYMNDRIGAFELEKEREMRLFFANKQKVLREVPE